MKNLSTYDIDIHGLKEKQYEYEFDSDNSFFEILGQDLVEKGHFKTKLMLDKSATMMMLHFDIEGTAQLSCDRSLENFEESFAVKQRLVLKFGDRDEELAEDIEMIRFDTTRINVARYIFDYIALALPMKRLHPKFRNEENEDDEENEIFVFSTDADESVEIESTDERWAALKNLKK